ncbi:MAG: hypothetical protein MHM6MM_002824 [Cercozoa sp. M6MM]
MSDTPRDSVLEGVRSAWRNSERVVYKDLPRLSRRIQVVVDGETKLVCGGDVPEGINAYSVPDEVFEESVGDNWAGVCNCLREIALCVGHCEEEALALQEAAEAHRPAENGDMQMALQALFQEPLACLEGGMQSRIGSVLRAMPQTIIFPAMGALTQSMLQGALMKDVRTPFGWQIIVDKQSDWHGDTSSAISVTHRRWMQSLDSALALTHHSIQWELKITLDSTLSEIKAAILRVLRYKTHPDAPAEVVDRLRQITAGGSLIIH